MKTTLLVLALLFVALSAKGQPPCAAALCYSGTCYTSEMCLNGCFCLQQGDLQQGTCYSGSLAPQFIEQGYRILQ